MLEWYLQVWTAFLDHVFRTFCCDPKTQVSDPKLGVEYCTLLVKILQCTRTPSNLPQICHCNKLTWFCCQIFLRQYRHQCICQFLQLKKQTKNKAPQLSRCFLCKVKLIEEKPEVNTKVENRHNLRDRAETLFSWSLVLDDQVTAVLIRCRLSKFKSEVHYSGCSLTNLSCVK